MNNIVPISRFAEELFRCVKTKDLAGHKPNDPRFNPYLELFPHQKRILDFMFTLNTEGNLPFKTYIYSCPKKSGKTMINSLVCTWFAFCLLPELGMEDEILIAANSKEHAAGRVYKAVRFAVLHEPLLRGACHEKEIGQWKIRTKRGIEIQAVASEAGTVAGANFSLVSFDELWAYTAESERMLYEELTPVPTKENSCRFISTYAGVPGESHELWELYDKATNPEKGGELVDPELCMYVNKEASICAYWDEVPRLPWHTPEYLSQQRATLRPFAYRRLWQNQWAPKEDGIDILEWNACVKQGEAHNWTMADAWKPNKALYLAVGIDASVKKDRSAVVTCFRRRIKDEQGNMVEKVFLGPRMTWTPDAQNPMDFEQTIEKFILELQKNYMLGPVYYDPYQMLRSSQILWKKGVATEEYVQHNAHGVEMCNHLLDLLRLKNLVMYEDSELRQEAMNVSLKEVVGKGHLIKKDQSTKKIDSIIALAMAALAAEKIGCSDDSFDDSIFVLRK